MRVFLIAIGLNQLRYNSQVKNRRVFSHFSSTTITSTVEARYFPKSLFLRKIILVKKEYSSTEQVRRLLQVQEKRLSVGDSKRMSYIKQGFEKLEFSLDF